MTTKIVKPKQGCKVVDPMSLRVVPNEGAEVPWNSYWMRRVAEGSLNVVEAKKRSTRKPKTESTEDSEK